MEEWISLLQNYSEILTGAAIILMGLILMIFLARILRQIKRLNKSLGSITGNMQAYFDVILKEDTQPEETAAETSEPPHMVREEKKEREEVFSEQELKKIEDEKLFNAVLQEYFS